MPRTRCPAAFCAPGISWQPWCLRAAPGMFPLSFRCLSSRRRRRRRVRFGGRAGGQEEGCRGAGRPGARWHRLCRVQQGLLRGGARGCGHDARPGAPPPPLAVLLTISCGPVVAGALTWAGPARGWIGLAARKGKRVSTAPPASAIPAGQLLPSLRVAHCVGPHLPLPGR